MFVPWLAPQSHVLTAAGTTCASAPECIGYVSRLIEVRGREILSDGASLALSQEDVPTRDELCITKEQNGSFSRLLKFLAMHEPTGYERDEAHKRSVVQYFALRSMLAACRAAKVSGSLLLLPGAGPPMRIRSVPLLTAALLYSECVAPEHPGSLCDQDAALVRRALGSRSGERAYWCSRATSQLPRRVEPTTPLFVSTTRLPHRPRRRSFLPRW
ncbi:hypothetical protein PybrP1_003180 [[Pythium] brassicae (nom. inval.)]|nr:hypothetical protein PybrP1_003180 [[Pythium] brassicae (nom. inval.)]